MARPHTATIARCISHQFIAVLLSAVVLAGQQTHPGPAFRTGVILVPVDVRVLDSRGRPVINLTADDFELFEDGVKQPIAHYSTRSYLADAPFDTPPRSFALVLGRGHLNKEGQAIEVAVDFVRSRLRPSDRIAVLAYHHATDLTTDHEAIVRLLERYSASNDRIEEKLERDLGVRLFSPNYPLSEDTRQTIRDLFDAPGLPAIHVLPDGAGGWLLPYRNYYYLRKAVDYLSLIEGEKHLVFVSEDGSGLPFQSDWVAGPAAAARVTVSLIVQTATPEVGRRPFSDPSAPGSRIEPLGISALRTLAEDTGGSASFYGPSKALLSLAEATSFQYVLGYYPKSTPREEQYRRLRISVKRRGLTVLYRHLYGMWSPIVAAGARHAHEEPTGASLNVRRALTEMRIREAERRPWPPPAPPQPGSPQGPSPIFCQTISGSVADGQDGETLVTVAMGIDPALVFFTRQGDQFVAALDVAVFVEDASGTPLGEKWERIDLAIDPRTYGRLPGHVVTPSREKPIPRTVTAQAAGRPARVKVVIYEYDSDKTAIAVSLVNRSPAPAD